MEKKKLCVFLADGFEEIEGLMVVDLLRRARVDVKMVSITDELTIRGRSGIEVIADVCFDDMDYDDVDMIVLPGGMPGTTYLAKSKKVTDLVLKFYKQKKYIAAICAAPTILGELGILEGREATCYPGMEDQLLKAKVVTDKRVVVDGHVITSRGLGTSISFSIKLIEELCGKQVAEDVADSVVFIHKKA